MTRCDYDGVFYRVFCITLLCIAFTFTVILTNVFIDIDGLLSGKHKEVVHHDNAPIFISETNDVFQETKPEILFQETKPEILFQETKPDILFQESKPENLFQEPKNEDEDGSNGYRNKRSLESTFQMHLKNPKVKKILTNRLAQLLEQLDAEEAEKHGLFKDKDRKIFDSSEIPDMRRTTEYKAEDLNALNQGKHEDFLHLAMHNILLQGIIGHMDLMDVYKKVHTLIKHIELQKKENIDVGVEMVNPVPSGPPNVEQEFFDEMVRCDRLHKEIEEVKPTEVKPPEFQPSEFQPSDYNPMIRYNAIQEIPDDGDIYVTRRRKNEKAPKMLIKTIIDITSLKDLKDNETNSDNVKGIIKLIYNGRPIKFKGSDDEGNKTEKTKEPINEKNYNGKKSETENVEKPIVPDALLRKAVADYFKDLKITNGYAGTIKGRSKINKRLKRNIKVKHHQKKHKHTTNAPTTKGDDDELYVEIETHFNNKGITGEKKRKLVKDIVAKIQTAIRNGSLKSSVHGKAKHLNIKKRDQNPLEHKGNVFVNKILIPVDQVTRRDSHPISKVVPVGHTVPYVADKKGSEWQKTYLGPHFFNPGKAINSGEMGQIDLDYKNVLKNGIPQRLQQPINTDGNAPPFDDRTYFDLGNLKFFIKEFDGTGFSIGFNQYVGEAPDQDAISIFTGLKQLISEYQQNVDNAEPEPVQTRLVENPNNIESSAEFDHNVKKRDAFINIKAPHEPHNIVRRSDEADDHHSNEYNIIFNNDFLTYDNYQEIYEDNDKKVSLSLNKERQDGPNSKYHNHNQLLGIFNKNIKATDLPFVVDEKILARKLKPSEIFGIANLLNRKKRSMRINKFAKIKPKLHTTYINTKTARSSPHQFFMKNKRLKRQTYDKIRLIASDSFPSDLRRRSDENIYVVSDEKLSEPESDSARDEEQEQSEPKSSENFALASAPYTPYDNRRIMPNYMPKVLHSLSNPNFFSLKSRNNVLMSKYPHIFMEEISRSKEDSTKKATSELNDIFDVPMPNIVRDMNNLDIDNIETTTRTQKDSYRLKDEPYEVKDLFNALAPKSSYKLTVKIQPKATNTTVLKEGFQEVHTSINKSVSHNGLIYSSQVNVSEMSKVEKDNNATTQSTLVKDIKDQQEKMKHMLKEHKMKIDKQLNNLQKDKQQIDDVMLDKKNSDTIEVLLPLNPPRLLHLNKDEASQLITSALMKLHDSPLLNDLTANHMQTDINKTNFNLFPTTNIPISTAQPTTTTIVSTKPYIPPGCPTTERTTPDPDKIRIIKTIQRNENLTNKILSKIDKNTEILQMFLKRLADRFDPQPHKSSTESFRNKMEQEYRYAKDWRHPVREPFYHNNLPKLDGNNNGSRVPIPFVYAYQQPYSLNPKDNPNSPNSPVANVVYQGHIHTNTNLNKIPFEKPAPIAENEFKPIPVATSQINTKQSYFNDELDFKLEPTAVKTNIYMNSTRI